MSPNYTSLVPGVDAPGMDNPAASGRDNDTDSSFVFGYRYGVPTVFNNSTDGAAAPSEWGIPNAWEGTWEWCWRRNIDNKVFVPMVSGWFPLYKAIPMRTGAAGGVGRMSYLGQCAPHPGQFLRGAKPHLNGKSMVHVAHLQSYMGDDTQGVSVNNRDCFGSGYEAGVASDIVLESMDLGLGADELNDAYYNHLRLTIINSFLGDPLHYSFFNPLEDHGFITQVGTGPGGQPEHIVVMRSMFTNATDRCPVTNARTFTVANCLVYNCGSITSHATRFVSQNASASVRANVLDTLYVRGPDNSNTLIAVSSTATMPEGSAIHIGGCAAFGWPATQQSDLFRIGPSGILSATIVADAYPDGWDENSTYKLGQVNAQIDRRLARRYWQLIAKTVGARPGWRLPQYSVSHRSIDACRRTIAGETLPKQFLDTVAREGMDGFPGGWFPVPRYKIRDPRNPGPHWHAPFPSNPNDVVGESETWGDAFWIPPEFRGNAVQLTGRKVWEKWARLQDWYVKDPRTMPAITAPVAEGTIPNQTGSTEDAFLLDVNDYFDGVALFMMGDVPGLAMDPVTGVISGTPATPGVHTVTVTGWNEEGTVEQVFTLTVPGEGGEPFPQGHLNWQNAGQTFTQPYGRVDASLDLTQNGFSALWLGPGSGTLGRAAAYEHVPEGGFYGRGASRFVPGYYYGDAGDPAGQHMCGVGQFNGLHQIAGIESQQRITLGMLVRIGSGYWTETGGGKPVIFLVQNRMRHDNPEVERNTRPMMIPQNFRDPGTTVIGACDGTICNTNSDPDDDDWWNSGGVNQPDMVALAGQWCWIEATVDFSVYPCPFVYRLWSADGTHQGTTVAKNMTEDVGGQITGVDGVFGFINSVASPTSNCYSEIELIELEMGVLNPKGPPPGFPGSTR